jgi:hypothetical protein
MNHQQQQQLKAHVSEIAKLLHADAQAQDMAINTLAEIEQTVRDQIQTHISSQVGNFLSTHALEKTANISER